MEAMGVTNKPRAWPVGLHSGQCPSRAHADRNRAEAGERRVHRRGPQQPGLSSPVRTIPTLCHGVAGGSPHTPRHSVRPARYSHRTYAVALRVRVKQYSEMITCAAALL